MVEHLKGRLDTERRLLAAMREARDEADREDHRRQAADLVATVEDCFARHSSLHVQLMEAERAFFEEQDRQAFACVRATRGTREITDELLVPLLEMTIDSATSHFIAFAERMWPPQPPVVARLGEAIALLLRPPQDRDILGEEIEEVEYDEPVTDPRVFDDAAWAVANGILESLDPDDEPVRLSELIERARMVGGDLVAELIRLRVMTAVAPLFDQLLPGGPSILAAGVDGALLPDGPLWGDDLLVGRLAPDDDALSERRTDETNQPLAEPIQLRVAVIGGAPS
jgi:hypothetical protein